MRSSASEMQSIKGSLLVLTLCLAAGTGVWGKPSLSIIDDIFGELKDGGKSIIEGLRNATEDGANTGFDILQKLEKEKGKLFNDLNQLGEDLSNAISEALATEIKDLCQSLRGNITALKSIVDGEKNLIKKRALAAGLAKLQELSLIADKLEEGLSNISLKLGEVVSIQLNNTISDLLKWGQDQLERVKNATDEAGLKLAEEIINQLYEHFAQKLVKVVEEIEVIKSQFEQALNDKLSLYAQYITDLIDAMNGCSILTSLRCKLNIDEKLEYLLSAKSELEELFEKGKNLIRAGVYSGKYFADFLKDLAIAKLKCEKDLDDIIKGNPSSTTSTTASSSSDGNSSTSNNADGSADEGSSTSEAPDDQASGLSSFLEGLTDKLSEGSKAILEGLQKKARAGKDILEGLEDAKGKLLADITKLGQELASAITESLITNLGNHITNLQGNITELTNSIQSQTNTIKKKALNNALTALSNLNTAAESLQTTLENINTQLADDLSSQVDEALDDLLSWGTDLLARVQSETDGKGVAEASGLINLLIAQYTRSLSRTLENFEIQKSDFEREVQRKINEYSKYATELIANMNRCLLSTVSPLRCQLLFDVLVQKVNNAKNDLNRLVKLGDKVIKAGKYAAGSVSSLLENLAKDKLKCEKSIESIIKNNPSETESSTSTTESTTVDSTESDSNDSSDGSTSSTDTTDENSSTDTDTTDDNSSTVTDTADDNSSTDTDTTDENSSTVTDTIDDNSSTTSSDDDTTTVVADGG